MIDLQTLTRALAIEWNTRTGEHGAADAMAAKAVESDPVEEAMRDGEEAYAVAFAFANLRLIINEHLSEEDSEAINSFDLMLHTLRNRFLYRSWA